MRESAALCLDVAVDVMSPTILPSLCTGVVAFAVVGAAPLLFDAWDCGTGAPSSLIDSVGDGFADTIGRSVGDVCGSGSVDGLRSNRGCQ